MKLKELQDLAPYLAKAWITLARTLPGMKVDTDVVQRENQLDPGNCPYDMLRGWLERNGSDATVRRLCTALLDKKVGQRNAAEEVYGEDAVKQVISEVLTPLSISANQCTF